MAWIWPFSSVLPDRRSQLAVKKRVRDAKRWMRSPRLLPVLLFAGLTVVCILLLRLGDEEATTPLQASPRYPPAKYWALHTVEDAKLPAKSYPPPKAVREFIAGATRYIIRANAATKTGRFAYLYTLHKDGSLYESRRYNTLRHSGAAYALADSCPPNATNLPKYCKGARVALVRAAHWLVGTSAPLGKAGAYGLWSRPADEHSKRHRPSPRTAAGEVRTGGIGLGLISLVAGRDAGAARVNAKLLRNVARGATDIMQLPNGAMASYYDAKDGIDKKRRNPYYNGEAALGLLYLYSANRNITLRESATRALVALATAGDARGARTSCDHWCLIATGKLLRDASFDAESRLSQEGRDTRVTLKRHAVRVLRACVARNAARVPHHIVRANGYGSSVEAQLNVLPTLAEDGANGIEPGIDAQEAERAWCLVKRTLGAMMSLQFHNGGENYGKILDGGVAGAGKLRRAMQMGREVRVRSSMNGMFKVDTTQHTLSGLLAYVRVASHPFFKKIVCEHEDALVEPYGVSHKIVEF